MNREELDAELSRGVVSAEGFRMLIDAEIYGTATPMQWLGKRLRVLDGIIAAGRIVEVHSEAQKVTLASRSEYEAWCARIAGCLHVFCKARVAAPNKPLVPTRNGEAPLLAAQRRRYA